MTEPLVILPASEVKILVADAVAAALSGRGDGLEKPLKVAEYAKHQGVADDVVRAWCDDGMPHYRTGNVRGIRIYPSRARAWLEENRG